MVSCAFLYYLFPSESVRAYIAHQVHQADPTLEMTIDDAAPALPPGLTLKNALIFKNSKPMAGAEKLKATPVLTTLLNREIAVNFKGDVYDGTLKGRVLVDRKTSPNPKRLDPPIRSLEANIAGIQVGKIHALRQFPDYSVSGKLNADLTYIRTDKGENGNIRVAAVNLSVRPQAPIFNIAQVTFNQIQAQAVLSPGRRLEIQKCSLAGPQLNGTISGSIRIADDPAKSALDLTGSFKPHPGFLADIGKGFLTSFLFKNRRGVAGGQEISFRIRGTIENPNFSLL